MIARAIAFARAHPRTLAAAAAAVFLLAGWWSLRPAAPPAPARAAAGSASSSSSASSSTARVLLATANLVVTVEGAEMAEVTFGPGGAPTGVRTRGGRLTVQARLETRDSLTTTSWSTASSSSSFSATEYQDPEAAPSRFPIALRAGIRPSGLWAAGLRWDFEAPVPFTGAAVVLSPGFMAGPGLLLGTLDIQPARRRRR